MTRVSINSGLLQMVMNGLQRDFSEGKVIRGEWLEEIRKDVFPVDTVPEGTEERVDAFLKELTELSHKYAITIGSCGCCGGPHLCVHDRRPGKYVIGEIVKDMAYELDYTRTT